MYFSLLDRLQIGTNNFVMVCSRVAALVGVEAKNQTKKL